MPVNLNGAPPIDTVVKQPPETMAGPMGDYIFWAAGVADSIPPWGTMPRERDMRLRQFWITESILASVIYTTVARYVAFGWTLNGPDRMVNIISRIINGFEWGKGWQHWLTKILIDLYT